MMKSDRSIIWLEDRIDRNLEIKKIIQESGFTLIECSNLEKLQREVKEKQSKPDQVAGFILDILITGEHNLNSLELPQIKTNLGNDTGMLVLKHFIRNTEDHDEIDKTWRGHKVLMLSCLGFEFMNSRYGKYMTWEDKQSKSSYGITTWLSKGDEYGSREESNKQIESWLNTL